MSIIAKRKRLSNPDGQISVNHRELSGPQHILSQGELLRHGMSQYYLTTCYGASLPGGAEFHTRKAPGVLAARLTGRDTDKPNA